MLVLLILVHLVLLDLLVQIFRFMKEKVGMMPLSDNEISGFIYVFIYNFRQSLIPIVFKALGESSPQKLQAGAHFAI